MEAALERVRSYRMVAVIVVWPRRRTVARVTAAPADSGCHSVEDTETDVETGYTDGCAASDDLGARASWEGCQSAETAVPSQIEEVVSCSTRSFDAARCRFGALGHG